MQELCQVAVEKSPKDSGGGRVKESKRNRTDGAVQVRLNFGAGNGKTKSPFDGNNNSYYFGFLL